MVTAFKNSSVYLFRYRGWISFAYFLVALILARPNMFIFCVSLFLLISGQIIRFWACSYVGYFSRYDKLHSPRLVTSGPYSIVRHPLYAANFLIGFAMTLLSANVILILTYVFLFCVFYAQVTHLEEDHLLAKFCNSFIEYRQSVPKFIPTRISFCDKQQAYSLKNISGMEVLTFLIYMFLFFAVYLRGLNG